MPKAFDYEEVSNVSGMRCLTTLLKTKVHFYGLWSPQSLSMQFAMRASLNHTVRFAGQSMTNTHHVHPKHHPPCISSWPRCLLSLHHTHGLHCSCVVCLILQQRSIFSCKLSIFLPPAARLSWLLHSPAAGLGARNFGQLALGGFYCCTATADQPGARQGLGAS